MKGLSIKKVAAIGIGAALVGSALAPIVSAANMVDGGLDGLAKDHVVDDMGAPVVDVVVGSGAAVSDVVWAGNIAAKVAQLATTSVESAAGEGSVSGATVDLEVGGQTELSGNGHTAEANLNFSGTEFNNIEVNDIDVPYLVNETGVTVRWEGNNQTASVREQITLTAAEASMQSQTGSTRYAVGELVSNIARNAVNYEVVMDLDTSATIENMDSNSNYDVSIPFLGKNYVLNEINTTDNSLIMYSGTIAEKLFPEESTTVPGSGNYDGKELTVELETVWVNSADGEYNAVWVLKDGETQVDRREVEGNDYDLRDEFGSNVVGDSVYVTNVAQDVVVNKYYASIRAGSERLELRDGEGFPYTGESTVDDDAQWKVELVGFSGGAMTSIKLKNNWGYTSTASESEVVKNVLTVGDQIVLPEEYGVVKFAGFENKPMYDAIIGNNEVSFRPLEGVSQVDLPMYQGVQLDVNRPRAVTVSGQAYTFMLSNVNNAPTYTHQLRYIKGDYSGATVATALGWDDVLDVNRGIVNNAVSLDVGARGTGGSTVKYDFNALISDGINDRSFLLLSAQSFDLYNRGKANAALSFVGTFDLNSTNVVENYFKPSTSEVEDALGETYDASNYYAAMFTYNDLDQTTGGDDVNMYIRADATANVWDYDSIKDEDADNRSTPNKDASYTHWSNSAIRGGDDYLLSGFTADGSEITSEAGLLKIAYPDERRQLQMFIGSDDTTETVVDPETFNGVAQGETATQGGVSVKINAVDGTCSVEGGEAVSVVAVPSNLVKTDASSYGKSIIVGGFAVNAAAENLEVSEGQTLEEMLTADGEYVAAVLDSGSIVVAGYSAADTGSAASELINALEALI